MNQVVLLVHHGTVRQPEEIPAFLKNVRRGREAPPELVQEIRRRYDSIGEAGRWGSPLDLIAGRIAAKLESRLGVPVRAAGRLWHPHPHEVVRDLGVVDGVAILPLAQHSATVYEQAARRDLQPMEVRAASNWGQTPALLDAFAERAREKASSSQRSALVLTAHSLPKNADDGYEREVRASADAIAERVCDVYAEVHVAFQSQGAGADVAGWLGPTLPETLERVTAKRVVIAPVGFLIDHVEILYDIDIEAHALARERGLELARTRSLNDSDDFIAVLEGIARPLLSA